jgi:hypothetical protein
MLTLPLVEIVNQPELDIPSDYPEVQPWYCWMPFAGVKYYTYGHRPMPIEERGSPDDRASDIPEQLPPKS